MGILNKFKLGPKIIGGYVVAALAMGILTIHVAEQHEWPE